MPRIQQNCEIRTRRLLIGLIETPGVNLDLRHRFSVKALLEDSGAGALPPASVPRGKEAP